MKKTTVIKLGNSTLKFTDKGIVISGVKKIELNGRKVEIQEWKKDLNALS